MGSPMKGNTTSSKQQLSPYKKITSRNIGYVQYTSAETLTKNKLFKIYDIQPTEHEKYGSGQLVFIQTNTNLKYKVQMPKKYLATLSLPQDIDVFKDDIAKKNNPHFIFRERLPDNSFRIDILQSGEDIMSKYKKWEDVDELEASDCSAQSVESVTPSKKPKVQE